MVARGPCPPGPCLAASLVAATLLYQTDAVQALRTRQPIASSWFGGNSEAESSFDATRGSPNSLGWEYHGDNPSASTPNGHSAESYHEAPSGAWKEAWQTHWPGTAATGAWKLVGGKWTEEYRHAAPRTPTVLQPEWFDSSVLQKDMFGRSRAPDADSPRRHLFWQERAVNTTLTCDTANCTGTTFLQAFNPSLEEVNHCKLSLFLHPTDFDDQYSGERLAWVTVNGQLVNTDCFPMISGCNATAQAPMYPCVQDLPLETILNETGTLEISAQISETVDECPFDGNLLSAVPMVTCQVKPRGPLELPQAQPELPIAAVKDISTFTPVIASVPLRCVERGCVARASITPTEDLAGHIRTYQVQCLMNVMLYQTDFDGEEGTPELLEYLRLNNSDVVTDFAPGANPCRSQWAGQPLPADRRSTWVVRNQDVTSLFLLDGGLNIEGKITNFVDECAHNGYLLDALVDLRCDLNPNATRLTTAPPTTTLEVGGTTPITHLPPLEQLPDLPPLEALVTPAPGAAPRSVVPAPVPAPAPPPPAPPQDEAEMPEPAPSPETTTTEELPPAPTPAPLPDVEVRPSEAPTPAPSQRWQEDEQEEAPEPRLQVAPFGRESTGTMLDQHTESTQDTLVDAMESAQVAEIKRSVFRALTRLRAAQIKEYDTISRVELQAIDEYQDNHRFTSENPLRHLHENEPAVALDKYRTFHTRT